MKHKVVTIKAEQMNIDYLIKDFNDAKWGVTGLFEHGSCSIREAHAMADVLLQIENILSLKEIGYCNQWERKVK
jgi:hypothetical protein|tara:strand:- start:279 stop:500 length:222 start_codon:yes stop_codon:yes gene_type:complete